MGQAQTSARKGAHNPHPGAGSLAHSTFSNMRIHSSVSRWGMTGLSVSPCLTHLITSAASYSNPFSTWDSKRSSSWNCPSYRWTAEALCVCSRRIYPYVPYRPQGEGIRAWVVVWTVARQVSNRSSRLFASSTPLSPLRISACTSMSG